MQNRISRKQLLQLIEKHDDTNKTRISVAREINDQYDTGYTDKHVADLVAQHRGTANTKKQLREGAEHKSINPDHDRDKLSDEIETRISETPGKPAQQMAREIIKDTKEVKYHVDYIAKIIREYKKEHKIETTIKYGGNETDDKYHVIDNVYKWKYSRGKMELPVELADQMFYEYSRHGLDLSQSQMRQKHDLKIWEWNTIKNMLFLYKDSNIFSPHTEDNTPREKLQQMVDDKMSFKMKDKQRLVESSYNRQTIKQYKKIIEQDAIATFAMEKMIDELNHITNDWSAKTTTVNHTEDFGTERKWLVASITDLHIGARVENLRLTPEFSPEQTRNLLDKVANKINQTNATDVSIILAGDIIESFTGLNHKNSWQSVEYGMVGAKVIKEAISLIEEFITKVNNVKEILGVAGNHDRITASNKEDTKGQVAEIIFYMLDRLYGNQINVQYSDLVLSKEIDGIQYIVTHGDKKVIREGKQAIIDYGDNKLFNVILAGHLHSRKVIEDQRSYRWIVSPSVFTGNRYSEENAWHARPGFLTFENDGTGNPIMTDYTIA